MVTIDSSNLAVTNQNIVTHATSEASQTLPASSSGTSSTAPIIICPDSPEAPETPIQASRPALTKLLASRTVAKQAAKRAVSIEKSNTDKMVIQEYQHIPIPSDLLVDLAGRGISIKQFTTALDVLNTPALLISLKNSGAIDQQVYYDLMKKYCLNVVSGSVANGLLADLNEMNVPFTLYVPSLKGLSSASLLMTLNHKKALTNEQYEKLYRKYCGKEQSTQPGGATQQLQIAETVSLSVGNAQGGGKSNVAFHPTLSVPVTPQAAATKTTLPNTTAKTSSTAVQKQTPPQTTQCLFSPLLVGALEKRGFVIKGHEAFIVDSLRSTGLLEIDQPITGLLMNLRLIQLLRKKNTVVGKDFVVLALQYCVNWGPDSNREVLDDLLVYMLYDIDWNHELLREFQEIADISDEVFKAIGSILLLKVNSGRSTTPNMTDSKVKLVSMLKRWFKNRVLTECEYAKFREIVGTQSEQLWQKGKVQVFMHMMKKVTNYSGGVINLPLSPPIQVEIPTVSVQLQEPRKKRGRDDPNVMVISSDEDEQEDEEPKKAQLLTETTAAQESVATQQPVLQGEIVVSALPQQVSISNHVLCN